MENNEAPAPRPADETPFIAPCDGCDTTSNLHPTDDGRALMCDECLTEYAEQE